MLREGITVSVPAGTHSMPDCPGGFRLKVKYVLGWAAPAGFGWARGEVFDLDGYRVGWRTLMLAYDQLSEVAEPERAVGRARVYDDAPAAMVRPYINQTLGGQHRGEC